MTRIIVADDHTLVRAGICALLNSQKDFQVIAETGNGKETVELCERLKPDILLLDLSMPEMDGLEATKSILSSNPSIKIVVLTMYENEEYATRLINAGAKGFLVKRMSPDELPDSIRKVVAGEVCITDSIMRQIALRKTSSGDQSPLSLLSDRELQIFHNLARGLSGVQVSDELDLSPSSVATYKSRIMDKLGLKNQAELMRFALRLGLIDKFE
ncbi:MAG TPA: response regulator transcription factor [bacterium]|nr:response regulator transcription factor [bacterium]HPI77626.1 response regulator transcription factor [bacterium]